ncbi:MAG TPA: hypothetical protein VND22_02760 [Actinomycetota bacterium]|nr:hypothetical protein [Actinomycetota bacterium]
MKDQNTLSESSIDTVSMEKPLTFDDFVKRADKCYRSMLELERTRLRLAAELERFGSIGLDKRRLQRLLQPGPFAEDLALAIRRQDLEKRASHGGSRVEPPIFVNKRSEVPKPKR